jgi:DNA-directed RNA polymerase sigma subunit (sigma70/sigma32)
MMMKTEKTATECTELLEDADDALCHLSPHEELLLRLRFGIGGKRQSAAVIARHFGLQPEDLRLLEARALTRLRKIAIAAEQAKRARGT